MPDDVYRLTLVRIGFPWIEVRSSRILKVAYWSISSAFVIWIGVTFVGSRVKLPLSFFRPESYLDSLERNASEARLVVYEGLPHPLFEHDLFERESLRGDVQDLDGHLFYERSLQIEGHDLVRLFELLNSDQVFERAIGYKLCGGFHADYCVEWTKNGVRCRSHICFGCHEFEEYGLRFDDRRDLTELGYQALTDLLRKYHRDRPVESRPVRGPPPPSPEEFVRAPLSSRGAGETDELD